MIVADVGQALVLLGIPLGALFELLSIEYLYVVAFLVGSLGLVFEIASSAFVPTLVGRERLVSETPLAVAAVLIGAQLVFGLAVVVYTVTSGSLRQSSTPDALRGRMTATTRVLALGLAPLGSLTGGVLGQSIGLQATLVVAAGGELLAAAWLAASPVRLLREMLEPIAQD